MCGTAPILRLQSSTLKGYRLAEIDAAALGNADLVPIVSGSGSLSVLIVDDYRDAAESLAIFFRLQGIRALTAISAADALEQARSHSFDVIIVELRLKGIDGWVLASELRESARQARLMALTTTINADTQSRCKTFGIDHLFIKPADPLEMIAVIKYCKD